MTQILALSAKLSTRALALQLIRGHGVKWAIEHAWAWQPAWFDEREPAFNEGIIANALTEIPTELGVLDVLPANDYQVSLGNRIGKLCRRAISASTENPGAYLLIRTHPAGFAVRQNGEIWIGPAHFLLYLSLATLKPIKNSPRRA